MTNEEMESLKEIYKECQSLENALFDYSRHVDITGLQTTADSLLQYIHAQPYYMIFVSEKCITDGYDREEVIDYASEWYEQACSPDEYILGETNAILVTQTGDKETKEDIILEWDTDVGDYPNEHRTTGV